MNASKLNTRIQQLIAMTIHNSNSNESNAAMKRLFALLAKHNRTLPASAASKIEAIKKERAQAEAKEITIITLIALCVKVGISTTVARRKLRKAGIQRPGTKWAWKSNCDLTEILSIIQ